MNAALPTASAQPGAPTRRLASLDILRGFDLFWILGLDEALAVLQELHPGPVSNFLAAQVNHSAWAGLTPYDLIFPLFVFIAGVSLVFSLSRISASQGKAAAVRRVLQRSGLLYLLGVVYYVATLHWGQVRLLGVLQRIALCYLTAGLLFLFLRWRGLLAALLILLVGYWAVMTFVPVPNVGAGYYSEGINLANYIDRQVLPLFKWDHDHDPEGLLSTLPAIGTCLLGVFAGMLLKNQSIPNQRKVFWLCAAGLGLLLAGYLWGTRFPIIKKIWTSSYVLVAGGYSALLLAFFYQAIEIWGLERWFAPFRWIGVNPIFLYVAYSLLRISDISAWLTENTLQSIFKTDTPLVGAVLAVALTFGLAYLLQRRRLFIRL